MPRLPRREREKVKTAVLLCKMYNYSTAESLDFVEKNVGIRISSRTLRKMKYRIREDAKAEIAELKRETFVVEAYQRIQEIRENYRALVELKTEARKIENQVDRVKTLCNIEMNLSALTIKLADLMDTLPFVAACQVNLAGDQAVIDSGV